MDFSSYLVNIPSPVEFDSDAYKTCDHIPFYKYQGCGNDFIMIDNQSGFFDRCLHRIPLIKTMCHRKFGVGADGVVVISKHIDYDFEMIYLNANGKLGLMCGNGARCALAFAIYLGLCLADKESTFLASDGLHLGKCISPQSHSYRIKMTDTQNIKILENSDIFMYTGSYHHICFVNDFEFDVKSKGRDISHREEYKQLGGVNVNFVKFNLDNSISIRTYERGVEDETMACGTGSVAAAIASEIKQAIGPRYQTGIIGDPRIQNVCRTVYAQGGSLEVDFVLEQPFDSNKNSAISDIFLTGPAIPVFHGVYTANI